MIILVLVFKKIESKDKAKYDNSFSSSKAEIMFNESDIDDVLKSVYTTIIINIQKSLGKVSGWIIDSVINHAIRISRYNPFAGSSYTKLPKELDNPRKGLTNIQNIDDSECFKWCLVSYLNFADHHQARITRAGRDFAKRVDFKDIKFPVKTRDIHKIEKKNYIGISVFGYEDKVKYPIHVSKKFCEDKHVDLLLIDEGEKKHYISIKDFNTCMYEQTLHRGRRHFCRYYLQAFRTAEKLKCHIKDFFKINVKQTIKMSKKGEFVKFKNFERKINSPFMIYADFESILVREDNGNQNPNEYFTNKYQKHVACSYGYKLVCVDNKFSKPFKSYLDEDAVYNFLAV